MFRTGICILALSLTTGCVMGPDYRRPSQALPQAFTATAGWKVAQPQVTAESDGWQGYQDAVLDGLLQQLDAGNPSLAAAEAAWREAHAALGGTRSALYPQLSAQGADSRSQQGSGDVSKNRNIQLGLAWQLDLWGQVRRQIEAGEARLDASAAEHAALRLSLQAMLVQNYIQLRSLDEQLRIMAANLQAYERVLDITENRHQAGMVTRADVSQALSQLKSTQAQQLQLQSQRQRIQHAVAALLGLPAGDFVLDALAGLPIVPTLPQTVPAELLERRPDIAAAEQRMMAANAEIGVARSAYFPTISLGATAGFRSDAWGGLVSTPNRFWSLGPQFDLRLFDAGARRAKNEQAEAAYDQQVARYRQAILEAMVEVEDALVQLGSLDEEYRVQAEALAAAQDALNLIEHQYQAGLVDFLQVSSALTTAHNAERNLLNVQASRLTASSQLVSALGGGWSKVSLPHAPEAQPPAE